MNVAIVGSRSFPQLKLVEWFIRDLPRGITIISGGAKGVDAAAEEAAKSAGFAVDIKLPDLTGCATRSDFTERYYARNQRIVDDAHLIVAFTEKDNGGTWDTIKRARKAGKPVKIIRPSNLFPSTEDEQNPLKGGQNALKDEQSALSDEQDNLLEVHRHSDAYQIKRASLGSYALRRKGNIQTEEWADFIVKKDNDPNALAQIIAPAMIEFFRKNNRFGIIHGITTAPRSIRNIEKTHVMDLSARAVADALGCRYFKAFEPWTKTSRGRFAKHGDITVTKEVSEFVGKVVWVLDDVFTTGYTMQKAVQGLMALEIHAHGLVYVYMA